MEAAAEADGFSGSRGPEHMGRQAARFLREHLRMEDVRQYVLDVLKTYSALQTFQVGIPIIIEVHHNSLNPRPQLQGLKT